MLYMLISWKNCFRIGVTALLLILCVGYFDTAARMFSMLLGAMTPIFIGLALAYLLNILMCFYESFYFKKHSQKKLVKATKRPLCLLASVLSLCSIIALVVVLVIPEIVSCVKFIVSEIPVSINKFLASNWVIEHIPQDVLKTLKEVDWQSYLSGAFSIVKTGFSGVVDAVISAVTSILSGVVTAFLSIVFAIYFLLFKEKLLFGVTRIINAFLEIKTVNKIKYVSKVCNQCFRSYIVGQCIEAVILGILCAIGMVILRMPYVVMISTLIGFTALIPIAGAYIGAAVGAFMILTVSPIKAVVFIIFLLILQQIEGNLIYPKVVGNSMGIPSVFVLLAITIGGGIAGIVGMLLSVPIVATVYRLLRERIEKIEIIKMKKQEVVKDE